jgi:deoxycytidylate deaminase
MTYTVGRMADRPSWALYATCDECWMVYRIETDLPSRAAVLSAADGILRGHGYAAVESVVAGEMVRLACPGCLGRSTRQAADLLHGVVHGIVDGRAIGSLPPDRPSRAEHAFSLAERARTRSTCRRAKIGAVAMTADGRIVATAYNGAPAGARHCVDLPEPIVFAKHDMHCRHAERNIGQQLRRLFDSIMLLAHPSTDGAGDRDELFEGWVRSQGITVYVAGQREVCTDCAMYLYRLGFKDAVTRSTAGAA